MITVLFVNSNVFLGGDTWSLGYLIESLKDEIKPIVLLREKDSPSFDFFNSRGVECIVYPYLMLYNPCIPPFWYKVKNVALHPWRARIFKRLRYELFCALYVKKKLAGRKVDLIHTNRAPIGIGSLLAKMLNAGHVWHIREYMYYEGFQGELTVGLPRLKKLINKAEARIVVSNPCRDWWNLKEENTWTLWDAVRSINDCCYEKMKQPYLLFCSHWINKAKGAGKVVAAYGMSGLFNSTDTHSVIRLKLVGSCEDEYKNELLTLAESYGCKEYVDFIPEQKDVKPFFAKAMAFINPSVNEGMGRTTAEAMFFGCPVIAHASGGTLDLIKDGKTGYLFNTVEECAELMKAVCATDQEEVILRAQEFVKQNFSVENYGKKVMEVYNSVLKTK